MITVLHAAKLINIIYCNQITRAKGLRVYIYIGI